MIGTRYNEALRLQERQLRFNIPALLEAGARSVGRTASDVRSFRKLAEGGFNRVFELTLHDGKQIIARLPYPVTQPRRLAVASEVATMDLARRNGVSVPAVFDYSADAHNAVGAEYILMEKVSGKPLGDVWYTMAEGQRAKVLSAVVDCEAKLSAIDLPASGSVFYEDDLPRAMDREPISHDGGGPKRLCVGPDVSLKLWFEERETLDISRGPCKTPTDVLLGAAAKEMAWLRSYAKPRMPVQREYCYINHYQKSDPRDHMRNLEDFVRFAPHLVPKEEWLCRPTLRHPDLRPDNILISNDFEITGIIDWQHCIALPLFLQAGIPMDFQGYGDLEEGLVKPQLPVDFDEASEDEQQIEGEKYRQRHVHFCYMDGTARKNKGLFDALMYDKELFRKRIYEHAAAPWEGNNVSLKRDLIHLTQRWEAIVREKRPNSEAPPPCPLAFEEQEVESCLEASKRQRQADWNAHIARSMVGGVASDGWISNEKYAEAKAEAARMKAEFWEDAEDDMGRTEIEKYWIFDDFDEKE